MRHTIDEAANLVGRTRRSLYRAMTEGRLAYGLETDGRRYIDTSELLRVYGAFEPLRLEIQQLRQENAEQRLIGYDKAPETKADDYSDIFESLKAKH